MRSALVAGATGLVGGELLGQLIDDSRYDRLWSIGRRTSGVQHSKLREASVDFDALDDMPGEISAEDVYCCLGTTIRKAGSRAAFQRVDLDYVAELARVMKARGAERFVLVSAVDADSSSRVFYNRVKGQAEEAVAAQRFQQSCAVRPSLLTGARSEFRLGERLSTPLLRLATPLLVGGARKYRPAPASHVAEVMRKAATRDKPGHHVQHCF